MSTERESISANAGNYCSNVLNTSVEYLTGLSDSPAATQIVIDKNKNPELFALVDLCQNKDTELLQRMLSYCNLLINS